ncbi:3-methyladenine DNA glycosylase/8-oxoguanine DNA glycosylase [Candidatus Nitrososphaera evergladensis SR1]|uniref:DNA-(apurinic or apyrimidinic site) lyase n=1 Tax=Candidatus Nitrososphaera evergladensis SR1 TaxID=1459636 RepID=A0A075MRA7_9ARCH|nr:DNA glycosylase [Candidatus Nitrososphaera evergladensis]AIF83630.1 3-methyladenine DNA glycosylase/8-oxoguanine DNA glycosylase [Candidatus Nitrososphaera evergladensis SR1]
MRQPPLLAHFDPETSVNSGQVFLWEKSGQAWYGIHADRVVKFYRQDGALVFESFPEERQIERSMFRLDDDTDSIFAEIAKDPIVKKLIASYPGLRLMRQDPAQCTISFVCASNTNIPMIRRMLGTLAKKYGQRIVADGKEFHTFPSVQALHKASEGELRACGLGYRAKAIKAAVGAMADGSLDIEYLKKAGYDEARAELLKVYGIGPKIADCILLFSLEKLDAFPIDVWIARALASHYGWLAGKKMSEKLTGHQYIEASKAARTYFGKYAGYAQQFLYYHMRQDAGKKW